MAIEPERVRQLNRTGPNLAGQYILYWSQMNRRVDSNHALLYAVELGNEYKLPILYYEGLTCSYSSANDRLHTFILQGVPETAKRLKRTGIGYCFYLRRKQSDPNDIVYRLAADAAAVVTDDYPTFIARAHNESVPQKLKLPYYVVDSSCIVPMSKHEKQEYGAYTIRPKIHRLLPRYLKLVDRLKVNHRYNGAAPRWHTEVSRREIKTLVSECEIDHSVAPSLSFDGGSLAAERHLRFFLEKNLKRYAKGRNNPSDHATSDLSPYLHFGQISSLEVAFEAQRYAKEHKLVATEFLEELVVRRELAFNYARFVNEPGSLENLPDWAKKTMAKHIHDNREHLSTRKQLENAATYDELWNATQQEMLLRGKIHGYYRMYWGKKILQWSRTYDEAVSTMIYLHEKYALDGRDPNTYANILWCFGLHDRPWGERPVFGTLRYMSIDGMKRKTDWRRYIEEIRSIETTGKDPHRVR
jgi:deoxyribodipyrimidine photo-lyase